MSTITAQPAIQFIGLGNIAHVRHDDSASCNIAALCVRTNGDVMQIVTGGLLDGIHLGVIIVNHGADTPCNAVRLTETCARAAVDVLDTRRSGESPEYPVISPRPGLFTGVVAKLR